MIRHYQNYDEEYFMVGGTRYNSMKELIEKYFGCEYSSEWIEADTKDDWRSKEWGRRPRFNPRDNLTLCRDDYGVLYLQ